MAFPWRFSGLQPASYVRHFRMAFTTQRADFLASPLRLSGVHGYGPHCGPNRLAQLPAGFNFITANLLLCCVCFCSSIRGTFIRVCLVCAIKRQKSMLLTHWKPFGVREDVICWYLLNSSNFDLLIPSSSQKIIARYFIVRAHILCGSCIVLLRLAFSYS